MQDPLFVHATASLATNATETVATLVAGQPLRYLRITASIADAHEFVVNRSDIATNPTAMSSTSTAYEINLSGLESRHFENSGDLAGHRRGSKQFFVYEVTLKNKNASAVTFTLNGNV